VKHLGGGHGVEYLVLVSVGAHENVAVHVIQYQDVLGDSAVGCCWCTVCHDNCRELRLACWGLDGQQG